MYDTASGSLSSQNLNYANQGAVNATATPSVSHALLNKLDQLQGALGELRGRQKNLLARLHGERPEKDTPPVGGLGGSGVLGEIDVRINVLASLIKDIQENQSTLDRLA